MAWHHVEDSTIAVPQYEITITGAPFGSTGYGRTVEASTRIPTGVVEHVTHSIWRCGNCRALACGKQGDSPPAKCGKCGAG
jgi:hypothetical protein